MAIHVICPNGHALRLNDSMAGRTGRCPVCHATVQVPNRPENGLSEDAILDLLGPVDSPSPEAQEIRVDQVPDEGIMQSLGFSGPRTRICEKCNQEIDFGSKVCPHCHTYLRDMAGQ